jgi:hypothetical protein
VNRGAVSDGEPRRRLIADAIRHRQHRRRAGHRDFTAAVRARIGEHALARAEAGHSGAGSHNRAGHLAARREREIRLVLIFAAHHQRVEKVQRGGVHANRHLARAGLRLRDIAHDQRARAIEAVAKDGFHRCISPDLPRIPASKTRPSNARCRMQTGARRMHTFTAGENALDIIKGLAHIRSMWPSQLR